MLLCGSVGVTVTEQDLPKLPVEPMPPAKLNTVTVDLQVNRYTKCLVCGGGVFEKDGIFNCERCGIGFRVASSPPAVPLDAKHFGADCQ